MKSHGPLAVFGATHDFSFNAVDLYSLANTHLPARMNQRGPRLGVICHRLNQQDLHLSSQILPSLRIVLAHRQRMNACPVSVKPRGKHSGVIQHQAIALAEESRKLSKHPVLPALLLAIKNKHSRTRPIGQRFLGD